MILLFNIGFLQIRFLDFIDILLVALLLYQLYRLVRGSLAFNILIGLLMVFIVSLVVRALDMQLLSGILGQFVGLGVIAVLIVFQPEVRRFLLYLGKGGQIRRTEFWRNLSLNRWRVPSERRVVMEHILRATERLSAKKTGALIVYAITSRLQLIVNTGVHLNAKVSAELLETIFFKNNPLHDGAVIVANGKIAAARCVLPISENHALPSEFGLRHRSALGMAEHSDAFVIVVSEESGKISLAHEGKMEAGISIERLRERFKMVLQEHVSDLELPADADVTSTTAG